MISRHDINTDWKKRELVINGAGHTHIVKQRQKTNEKTKKHPTIVSKSHQTEK